MLLVSVTSRDRYGLYDYSFAVRSRDSKYMVLAKTVWLQETVAKGIGSLMGHACHDMTLLYFFFIDGLRFGCMGEKLCSSLHGIYPKLTMNYLKF